MHGAQEQRWDQPDPQHGRRADDIEGPDMAAAQHQIEQAAAHRH